MVWGCSGISLQSSLPAASLALSSCFSLAVGDLYMTSLGLLRCLRLLAMESQTSCSLASLASFPGKAPGPMAVDNV